MKTGFICESGFNVVASATRDGRKLVAVVLGEPSVASRNDRATELLENGFRRISGNSVRLKPRRAGDPNLVGRWSDPFARQRVWRSKGQVDGSTVAGCELRRAPLARRIERFTVPVGTLRLRR